MPRRKDTAASRVEAPREPTEDEILSEALLWLGLHPDWKANFKISPEQFCKLDYGRNAVLQAWKTNDDPRGLRFYYEFCHYTGDFNLDYLSVKTVRTWLLLHNIDFMPRDYAKKRSVLYIVRDVIKEVNQGTFATNARNDRILLSAFEET